MTLEQIKRSNQPLLTPADVAEALGSNPQTIRLAARQGTLGFPCIIYGTRVRIPRKPFLEFLGEVPV